MQLSGMSYPAVISMPVDTMYNYIDWKNKYDRDVAEAKRKAMEEARSKMRSVRKR